MDGALSGVPCFAADGTVRLCEIVGLRSLRALFELSVAIVAGVLKSWFGTVSQLEGGCHFMESNNRRR